MRKLATGPAATLQSLHGPDILIRQPVPAGTVLFLELLCPSTVATSQAGLQCGGETHSWHMWGPTNVSVLIPKTEKAKRSSFISSDVARVWVLRQLSGPASRFLDLPACLAEVRFFSWAKDALQVLQLVKSHTVHINAWDSDLINWGTIIHTSEDTATVWLETITQRPSYFGSRIFWLCKYLFIGLDGSSLRERIGRGQELTQLLLDEI